MFWKIDTLHPYIFCQIFRFASTLTKSKEEEQQQQEEIFDLFNFTFPLSYNGIEEMYQRNHQLVRSNINDVCRHSRFVKEDSAILCCASNSIKSGNAFLHFDYGKNIELHERGEKLMSFQHFIFKCLFTISTWRNKNTKRYSRNEVTENQLCDLMLPRKGFIEGRHLFTSRVNCPHFSHESFFNCTVLQLVQQPHEKVQIEWKCSDYGCTHRLDSSHWIFFISFDRFL